MADIMARIYLYPTLEGGLLEPIGQGFRCPVQWELASRDHHFNLCAFDIRPGQEFAPGQSFTVEVWFLSRLAEKLKVGLRFKLWSSRFIGEGEITEISSQQQ